MTTSATTTRSRTAGTTTRPMWPMGRRLRRSVLVLHILSAGSWVGIDVLVAVLVYLGMTAEPSTAALAYQALGAVVVWPMLGAALATLATGLLLGLGTKWGLVRYRWVLVKLVITIALTVLVVVALRPSMPEAVEYGEQLGAGIAPTRDVSDLIFPPVVSLVALSFATTLSVFKPWGRTRQRRPEPRGRRGRGRAPG